MTSWIDLLYGDPPPLKAGRPAKPKPSPRMRGRPRTKPPRLNAFGTNKLTLALADIERTFDVRLRANRLSRRLWRVVRHSAEALAYMRPRVNNPNRWDAWVNGVTTFTGDKPCTKCGSMSRRTVDSCCHACVVSRRPFIVDRGRWRLVITNNGAGTLKAIERRKASERARAEAGEHTEATFGPFNARQYPDGRLAVCAPGIVDTNDLKALGFTAVDTLYHKHPEFQDLLTWAGWT